MEGLVNELTIKTPRLLLRSIKEEDAADMFLIRSDPECVRYTPLDPETDVSQSLAWIRKLLTTGKDFTFVFELSHHSDNTVVDQVLGGNVDSNEKDTPPPKAIGFLSGRSLPEIGYGVNRSYWRKGYMTEALQAFISTYWKKFPHGFSGLKGQDQNTLKAVTDERNVASIALLKKCEFKLWKTDKGDGKKGAIVLLTFGLSRPGKGKDEKI